MHQWIATEKIRTILNTWRVDPSIFIQLS